MTVAPRPPAFFLFPAGLVLVFAVSALPGPGPLYGLLTVGVAVFGLPHGSLDTAVARHYLRLETPLQLAGFFIAYLSLGGLVVAGWWQAPTAALATFLLYSAIHFGNDVAGRLGRLGGAGYGLWLLAMPLTLQPDAVLPLFRALGATQAQYLVAAGPWALGLGGLLLATALQARPQRATSDWRDPLLFVVAGAGLHPLAYFVAYFCFLHSPRHLTLASRDLGLLSWQETLKKSVPTTLAAYVLVLAALPFMMRLPMDAVVLQLVFVTLAALTVPHMLLEIVASPRRAKSEERADPL